MERNWTYCEDLLKRMAKVMGVRVIAVPASGASERVWYVVKKQEPYVYRLTLSYVSPKILLDKFLNYYREFMDRPGIGRAIPNPFFGMSPEEAELRLAVMGI